MKYLKTFEENKHKFGVLVNSSLLSDPEVVSDFNVFIENIKPAWTEYILVADIPDIKDIEPVPSDTLTINLFP